MRLLQGAIATALAAIILAPSAGYAQLSPAGEGRRAWLQYNCYGCHGNNAAGGMGPNVQNRESGDVNDALNGDAKEGGMRSFVGVIPSSQMTTVVTNITAYLASIGTANEPKWLDWGSVNPKY